MRRPSSSVRASGCEGSSLNAFNANSSTVTENIFSMGRRAAEKPQASGRFDRDAVEPGGVAERADRVAQRRVLDIDRNVWHAFGKLARIEGHGDAGGFAEIAQEIIEAALRLLQRDHFF